MTGDTDPEVTFLIDVDNTLLDNDQVTRDLSDHLRAEHGEDVRNRYFAIFEQVRAELGYADYLGALQRYRLEEMRDPRVLKISCWLLDYPFAKRLYPDALDLIAHLHHRGRPVVLSDGDAVFQPRKIVRSGLWEAFDDNVLIYIHKEQELPQVERLFPARQYVFIDDKTRILAAVKKVWGPRVTTVFARQGHHALAPAAATVLPLPDVTIDRIGDLLDDTLLIRVSRQT